MNNSIGTYFRVPVHNLPQVVNGFFLGHSPPGGDKLGQIPTLAEFGNNIGIIFGGVDIVHFDNVLALLECLENINFGGE